MTLTQILTVLVGFGAASLGGLALGVITRRWNLSDRGLNDAASIRLKELERQGEITDDLRERSDVLELRIAELQNELLDERARRRDLEGGMDSIRIDLGEVRERLASGEANGGLLRRVTRLEERARKYSPRLGPAGEEIA